MVAPKVQNATRGRRENLLKLLRSDFSALLHWRWVLAFVVFACGLTGFLSGVEVSERDIRDVNLATKIYYTLGLFILGGMDLGVPVNGPLWGKVLLWVGYFGAPALMGSTIVDWVHQVVSNQKRWLRTLRGHTVIIGTNDITYSILDKLEELADRGTVVIVDRTIGSSQAMEFNDRYGARVLEGDFTNDYFLSTLRLSRAKRIVLASENDFDNFEAASKILELAPNQGERMLVHSNRLRFMRVLHSSKVVAQCTVFNSYHLAAKYFVKNMMMLHFKSTEDLDTVILAGFGRFGQTILEELQALAIGEISEIGIIDIDANRRVMVANEQSAISDDFRLHILQGEIGHPEVWQQLEQLVDLEKDRPFILMATGMDNENLRTGLWLKKRYPQAEVMVRSARPSHFAASVCESAGIRAFGLSQVIHDSLPEEWFR